MVNSESLSKSSAKDIQKAAERLKSGYLVAFPTETVYGLGADATNENAVKRIYEVKGRPTDHPLIVHVSSINALKVWAKDIPDYSLDLARAFWPGPMTLILKRKEIVKDLITGGQDSVGQLKHKSVITNLLVNGIRIFDKLNLPFGLSILVVARKLNYNLV